ncbi:uncharacterized protein AMSG_05225 [Thecamonas trahens ATCC 50062]|uniref:Uncharacterized protein n=1 Tax=Thecamonas trahens ATCC 50062 TaxID=461836 RepID=A0A0L0DAH2_THETB|nr:hypothetical protein AMSG_05225 [Thecamonas trahens ATCC 50062]KNC49235.1 hypothetical protein AMSG_05225 [Thecamonas trahens ATCC 50062]|eukprot:XP_013757952.1 hypothetical protein AMSG_05225 [Thecamonas trahens ATCC 50062]
MSSSSYSSTASSTSFSSSSSSSGPPQPVAAAERRRRRRPSGKSSRRKAKAQQEMGKVVDGADDVCACRWGDNACWGLGCSPCCGDGEIEPEVAVECLVCWICCGPCSTCKLFASSVNQPCAVGNHIVPVACCSWFFPFIIRHNVRVNGGHGHSDMAKGCVGDIAMPLFCLPCTFFQILREPLP